MTMTWTARLAVAAALLNPDALTRAVQRAVRDPITFSDADAGGGMFPQQAEGIGRALVEALTDEARNFTADLPGYGEALSYDVQERTVTDGNGLTVARGVLPHDAPLIVFGDRLRCAAAAMVDAMGRGARVGDEDKLCADLEEVVDQIAAYEQRAALDDDGRRAVELREQQAREVAADQVERAKGLGYTVEGSVLTSGVDMVTKTTVWGAYLALGLPAGPLLIAVGDSEAAAWASAVQHAGIRS